MYCRRYNRWEKHKNCKTQIIPFPRKHICFSDFEAPNPNRQPFFLPAAPPRNSPPPQSAPPTAPVRPAQSRPPPEATTAVWAKVVGTGWNNGDSMGDGWKPQKMKEQKRSDMNLLSRKWRCSEFELLASRSVERHMGADFPIVYYST